MSKTSRIFANPEQRTSNTVAGMALLGSMVITRYFFLTANDVFSFGLNLVIALGVGAVVFYVCEYVRKKFA